MKIEIIHALLFAFSGNPRNWAFRVLFADDGRVRPAGCIPTWSHCILYFKSILFCNVLFNVQILVTCTFRRLLFINSNCEAHPRPHAEINLVRSFGSGGLNTSLQEPRSGGGGRRGQCFTPIFLRFQRVQKEKVPSLPPPQSQSCSAVPGLSGLHSEISPTVPTSLTLILVQLEYIK